MSCGDVPGGGRYGLCGSGCALSADMCEAWPCPDTPTLVSGTSYPGPVSSGNAPRKNALFTLVQLLGASVLTGVVVAAIAMPGIGGAGVTARNAAQDFENLPSDLNTPPLPERSVIYASDGKTKLAQFYYQNRVSVPLKKIAPVMQRAIVAIEDSRFFQHGGLDFKGTARALINDTSGGAGRQGGSTLTQQYVKNVLVTSATTKKEQQEAQAPNIGRKLQELRYALTVEKKYSKNEILNRYLNIAYFGDGAYGVEAAARHYFDTSASKLTLKQAATLAGIVRNPYAYAPTLNPKAAKQRRDTVLLRMRQLKEISPAQEQTISKQGLGLDKTKVANGCQASEAPFFCDYVIREIQSNPAFGKTPKERTRLLLNGGLKIKTTLNTRAQKAAQQAVDRYVPRKDPSHKAAAEAMVEPGTGKIRAIAVDRDFGADATGRTTVNFAADADHGSSHGFQPGSTMKAFTLVAALRKGLGFGTGFHSPAHTTVSGYTNCDGQSVGSWDVRNAGDSESGNFDMRQGTGESVNTYFAQLEKKAGLCNTVKAAKDLGIHRADGKELSETPAFTLGANEISPVTLASAYAGLAARGKYCKPIVLDSITDSAGKDLDMPSADCRQTVSKDVADATNYLLQYPFKGGTAAGLSIGRPAAGKTGTTDGSTYGWFAGFTPNLASAVMTGDPRGGEQHPMRDITIGGRYFSQVYGADIAGPIWQKSMEGALIGMPAPGFPSPPSRFNTKSPFAPKPKPKPHQHKKPARHGPGKVKHPGHHDAGHGPGVGWPF